MEILIGAEILKNQAMLYVSIGTIGTTVMPHNLYLHSSIVQTRKYEQTPAGMSEAIRFATIDSSVTLMFALFINAAILIVSASAFHWSGHREVAEIQDAYKLLTPLLGVPLASGVFIFALLASGQNSTLTGTLGNPPEEILKAAESAMCDWIALGSHGHRFLGDILHGSTISAVRYQSLIPVLVIPARKAGRRPAPAPMP